MVSTHGSSHPFTPPGACACLHHSRDLALRTGRPHTLGPPVAVVGRRCDGQQKIVLAPVARRGRADVVGSHHGRPIRGSAPAPYPAPVAACSSARAASSPALIPGSAASSP